MKTCKKCGIEKDENNFNKSSKAKDGLQTWCRECSNSNNKKHYKENISDYEEKRNNNKEEQKLYMAQYWEKNSETLKADNRKSYAENRDARLAQKREHYALNPEKMRIRGKKFSDENKEKILSDKRDYYIANKETILIKNKIWRQSNGDVSRIHSLNRRARKKAVGGVLSPDLYEKLFKLQRGHCAICKIKLPLLGDNNPMDHVVPLTPRPGDKQGTNEDSNMQLLCQPCNNRKHNKDPLKFMQEMGYLI